MNEYELVTRLSIELYDLKQRLRTIKQYTTKIKDCIKDNKLDYGNLILNNHIYEIDKLTESSSGDFNHELLYDRKTNF